MDKITRAQCIQWINKKSVNPLTGRIITVYGPRYKTLVKECRKFIEKDTPPIRKSKSPKQFGIEDVNVELEYFRVQIWIERMYPDYIGMDHQVYLLINYLLNDLIVRIVKKITTKNISLSAFKNVVKQVIKVPIIILDTPLRRVEFDIPLEMQIRADVKPNIKTLSQQYYLFYALESLLEDLLVSIGKHSKYIKESDFIKGIKQNKALKSTLYKSIYAYLK